MRENAFFTCQAGRKWLNSTLAAGVAQLAEQLICNQQVAGSSPIASSRLRSTKDGHLPDLCGKSGGVPEWPKGTDCKSVVVRLRWFKSTPLHHHFSVAKYWTVGGWFNKNCLGCRRQEACRGTTVACGNSSTARASAFQAEGCGFESRFPLHSCWPYPPSVILSANARSLVSRD